ncbi:MAG TPA: FkbM family methyltransferase [Nitrosopumilaceae archaeon]|jgi:FkbM family methyltransferase|nr:FkbM family methyltransferase [Nitrosopumilaceae archaeon]
MTTTLQTLAEHTVDISLLPESPIVLDGGCRGYGFCRDLLKLRPKAYILAVDADEETEVVVNQNIHLATVAIVGDPHKKFAEYYAIDKGNKNSIVFPITQAELRTVPCKTISELMDFYGIFKWDLIKLDVEGSEFDILENWPGPIANQITVEFHDYFDKKNRWDDKYFKWLLEVPLKDYEAVQNEKYPIGNGCFGHWDSLFKLKNI